MIHWVIGPPGAGKSTVGNELAARRTAWFIDLDRQIELRAGMSVAEIFATGGEEGFRERERETLLALVEEHKRKRMVVAVGGGAVIDPRNRDLMRSTGLRILLEVDADTAVARIGNGEERPLLSGDDPERAWRRLYAERKEAYADHDIAVSGAGSPKEVAGLVVSALYKFHSGLWRVNARFGEETSRIYALRSPYSALRAVRRMTRFNRRCIITDSNLSVLYGRTLERLAGKDGLVIVVEPGEESKSFETVERLVGRLLDAGFSRADCIVGFGGGVVTDLAGFVASIYMRGLRCISIPTSLLAMVDASVGGKTAINASGIRNLVGTFRQPTDVLICPAFLHTLPPRELRSGMVEALKMGMITFGNLHEQVLRGTSDILAGRIPSNVHEIVRASVEAKLEIIGTDVKDEKDRNMLNLGHTFGHALEGACPGEFTHGEAVAFGIVAAVELAAEVIPNIRKEVLLTVAEDALPYTFLPSSDFVPDFPELLRKMGGDKKQKTGSLRFVLPLGEHGLRRFTLPLKGKSLLVGVPAEDAQVLDAMERAWRRIQAYHRAQHHRRKNE